MSAGWSFGRAPDRDTRQWDPAVVAGSPHASPQPLSNVERQRKRRQLQELERGTLGHRALQWFMSCLACQTFWTALLVYGLTRGVAEPGAWVVSAFAYSGAAVALRTWLGAGEAKPTEAGRSAPGTGGCRGCGK